MFKKGEIVKIRFLDEETKGIVKEGSDGSFTKVEIEYNNIFNNKLSKITIPFKNEVINKI